MSTLSPTHQTALDAWKEPLSAREDQIHFLAVWLQDQISSHLCDEPGPTSLWSPNIDRLEAFLSKAAGLLPNFTPARAIHALVVTLLYKMGNNNSDFRFNSGSAELLYYQAIIQITREIVYRFTAKEFFDKLQLSPNVENIHLDGVFLKNMDDMIVRVMYPLPGDRCTDAFTQSYLNYLDILGDVDALEVSNDELQPSLDIAVSGPVTVGSVLPIVEAEEADSLLVAAGSGSLKSAIESSVRSSLATDLSLASSQTSTTLTTGHRNDPFDRSTPVCTEVMKGRTSVLSDETIAAHVQESDVKNPLSSERPELSRNIFSSFVEIYVNEGTPYPSRKSHLTQGVTVHTRHVRSITPTIPIDESHSASSDSSSLNESKFKSFFAASSRRLFRSSEHSKLVKAAEKLERGHCPAQAEYPSTKYWRLPLSLQWGLKSLGTRYHLVIRKPANWLRTGQSTPKWR